MATRKPQDHLPPKNEPVEQPKPDGWDLLKPFDQVPVWEQTDLIAIVQPLMPDVDPDGGVSEIEIDLKTIDLTIVGQLAKRLQDFAVAPDAYRDFVSGPGALERAIELGLAYAIQLGESGRSTGS